MFFCVKEAGCGGIEFEMIPAANAISDRTRFHP
jgi:hypothetical protein